MSSGEGLVERRVVIYCRISSDKAGAGLGVSRQETECRELAERLGWEVVGVRVDNDISAYGGKRRKGYELLLADVTSGRADAVIAWHPDRLHRRPIELEGFIAVVEASGAMVKTVTAGDLDLSTSSGRMVARMVGAGARHEVEHMVERIVSKKVEQAQAGVYRGGGRPFGYEGKPADGRKGVAGMVVREDEADELRDAAARVLAGETLTSVAEDWNARGVYTVQGKQWSTTSVLQVLVRARNAALIEAHGRIIGPAKWPAILDEATWSGLRARFVKNRTYRPKVERLLSGGAARCGWPGPDHRECGRALVGAGSNGSGQPRYRCASEKHFTRNAEPLDRYVEAVAIARLARPDAAELVVVPSTSETAALHTRAGAVRAKLDALTEEFMADRIDRHQLSVGTERGRAELAGIEAQLADLTAGSALAGIAGRPDAAELWVDLTISRQRAIIAALMDITVLPSTRGGNGGTTAFDPDTVRITPRNVG